MNLGSRGREALPVVLPRVAEGEEGRVVAGRNGRDGGRLSCSGQIVRYTELRKRLILLLKTNSQAKPVIYITRDFRVEKKLDICTCCLMYMYM